MCSLDAAIFGTVITIVLYVVIVKWLLKKLK
jgi:hypothetical protein